MCQKMTYNWKTINPMQNNKNKMGWNFFFFTWLLFFCSLPPNVCNITIYLYCLCSTFRKTILIHWSILTLIRSVPLKVRVGHRGPDIEGRLDIFLCLVHVLDHLDLELFQVWLNILLLLWDVFIPRNSVTTWNTLNKKERFLLFTHKFPPLS